MPSGDHSFENILKDTIGTTLTIADNTAHTVSIDPAAGELSWAQDIQTHSGGPDPIEGADRKNFGDHKKCDRCPVALECMAGSAARSWQLPTKFAEVKEAVRVFCIEKGQVKLVPAPYQTSVADDLASIRSQVGAAKGNQNWYGNLGATAPPVTYTATNAVGGMVKSADTSNTWIGDEVKMSGSTAEVDAYEQAFGGEVSLLTAIKKASGALKSGT